MSFINLKVFKTTVDSITKLCAKNDTVRLTLSKEGSLSFSLLLPDVQVIVPLTSSSIKPRSLPKQQSIEIAVKHLTSLVKKLPILIEEVALEITPEKLTISGEYDWSDEKGYYLRDIEYSLKAQAVLSVDFALSEEQVTCFETSADIANALKQAQLAASKTEPSHKLTYINLTCESETGELVVKATDGHKIYQKRLYALSACDVTVDTLVAPQLGKVLGKLLFTSAKWQVYQNFVKLTLDTGIEILAARSTEDSLDVSKYDDRAQHVAFVINPHELKSRLAKIKGDVTLHVYSQNQDELLAIEYSEHYGDGVAVSWVQTQKQSEPAYVRVNSGLLTQALKQVKKTTKEILFRLPKFDAGAGISELQTSFVEFDGNSYLIGGVRAIGKMPAGVREWAIGHDCPIIPESLPPSTKALSVTDLSSRWDGKGWQQPEIVQCECGSACDLTQIEERSAFKLYGRCPYCEQDAELNLARVDYKCSTCGVNHVSTKQTPIVHPKCMNCGEDDFETTHTLYCECGTRIKKENLKVCWCDSEISEEFSWHCDSCLENFNEDELSSKAIEECAEIDRIDGSILGFNTCPYCQSEDSRIEPEVLYFCETCELSNSGFHVPEIQPPVIECPECESDISDIPAQIPTDPFVVTGGARF